MKEVVIHVPGNTVGWIIGKGGANIKNMQMQMNTKVNIDTEDVNNQRKITVRGLAAGVDSTIAEINAIVSQAESSRSNQKVSWDPYDTTSQFIGASAAQNPAFMPAQTPDASASSQDQIALAAVSAVQAAGIDTALISSGDATALSYYQHYYAYYYKQATGQDFPGAHSSNSE